MAAVMPTRVGVILSGCGSLDGSETAVSRLITRGRGDARVIGTAPDRPHVDPVDPLTDGVRGVVRGTGGPPAAATTARAAFDSR